MHEQGRLYDDEPQQEAGEALGSEGDEATTAELTFEEAFSRLEHVVARLESGEAALEDSLRLFEEGVRLARFCRTGLDRAETRIRVLVEGKEGESEKQIAAELQREIDGNEDGIG